MSKLSFRQIAIIRFVLAVIVVGIFLWVFGTRGKMLWILLLLSSTISAVTITIPAIIKGKRSL